MSTHLLTPLSKDILTGFSGGGILVFKTNVTSERELDTIRHILDQLVGRGEWNIDMANIDKVLRVKTASRQVQEIIQVMQEAGFFCEELPD